MKASLALLVSTIVRHATSMADDPQVILKYQDEYKHTSNSLPLSSKPIVRECIPALVPIPYLHESPVYIPGLNKLFFSELPPTKEHFVIDLNASKPTLSRFTADPPIYVPNGVFYHNGRVVYSVSGSKASVAGGSQQHPGIISLDPHTLKTESLLDNYFGFAFTDCDDDIIDPQSGFV
ncbi:hypothetical protein T440DRAFT_542026 [Plenodomus tracheiphilus IPT5]|uniref:Uncharacterized protein n=1 Tax=Plenodomus tracheiphilus IPT5 TaxID=1408161 RepID=A0A6A7BKG4_9PLEO|nr:hypothetical protein T440DRAFT_542026 [Plenodomus tracheiphilus IPT5]